jgi:hypothetical protein
MSTYRVATGHDIALASLTVLSPQPDPGPAIQTTRRTYAADGSVTDQGRYVVLSWSAYTNGTDYQTLLGQFGLSAATSSAAVTVYVRDETFTWVLLNGIAIRPEPGPDVRWGDVQSRPLGIRILVRDLANLSKPQATASDNVTASDSVTVSVV